MMSGYRYVYFAVVDKNQSFMCKTMIFPYENKRFTSKVIDLCRLLVFCKQKIVFWIRSQSMEASSKQRTKYHRNLFPFQ